MITIKEALTILNIDYSDIVIEEEREDGIYGLYNNKEFSIVTTINMNDYLVNLYDEDYKINKQTGTCEKINILVC